MQSDSSEAAARAIDRWRQTSSLHWMVAALYRVPPFHAVAPELVEAAAEVRPARTVILDSFDQPVFDEDATYVLNERFPLDRLVDAALSVRLPARLRTRAAITAFSRAIVLRLPDQARRVAPVLEELAPQLRTDLRRYVGPSSPRRRARVRRRTGTVPTPSSFTSFQCSRRTVN